MSTLSTQAIITFNNGQAYLAVTHGAVHYTNDRGKAYRFATADAAAHYIAKRLAADAAHLTVLPARVGDGYFADTDADDAPAAPRTAAALRDIAINEDPRD